MSTRYSCVDAGPMPGVPGNYRLYTKRGRGPLSVLYRDRDAVITDFDANRPTQYVLPAPVTPADCDRLVAQYEAALQN